MRRRVARLAAAAAEETSYEDAVFPLPVELAVAALDPDFFKPGGAVRGAAGLVVGEHAAGQFVEPVSFRFGAELDQERAAESAAAGGRVDVDGVLADALVDAAV